MQPEGAVVIAVVAVLCGGYIGWLVRWLYEGYQVKAVMDQGHETTWGYFEDLCFLLKVYELDE